MAARKDSSQAFFGEKPVITNNVSFPILDHFHRLFALLVVPLFCATPAAGQNGGGDTELLLRVVGSSGESFATAVASAGDLNGDGYADILVGALGATPGGQVSAGSAYAYSGANGLLLFQWDGTSSHGFFGKALASAGDVNGDGFPDVIVAAPSEDPGGLQNAGTVSLYSGFDGSLIHKRQGFAASDSFGWSVAGGGDVDGDGVSDIIIGAPGANGPGGTSNLGLVYVFSGADNSLIFQVSGTRSNADFGWSVADAGDVDGDGHSDVIVGAPHGTVAGGDHTGEVFLYSGRTGYRIQAWVGEREMQRLGYSVAGLGDVNGDGLDDVVMGGPYWSLPGYYQGFGKAFAYSGGDGALLFAWKADAQDDNFGITVSAAGDTNGDGVPDVLIGASLADRRGRVNSGSIYLYSGMDGSRLHRWDGATASENRGLALAGVGDVNGDGLADVLMGTRWPSPTATARVFSYDPFILADSTSISSTIGGTINLELDFPDSAAFYDYRILLSLNGTGPMLQGVEIPLTADALLRQTNMGIYPFSSHSGMQSALNATGSASASLSMNPGSIPASFIGHTFWLAAVASPSGLRPAEYSSAAVPIEVTP